MSPKSSQGGLGSRRPRSTRLRRRALAGATAVLVLSPFPAMADVAKVGTNNVFQLDNTTAGGAPFAGFVFGGVGQPDEDVGPFSSVSDASSFVVASGMLDSPFYRSSATGDPYFGLTYEPPRGVPMSFALGVGTGGSDWHGNAKLVYSQEDNGRETVLGVMKGDIVSQPTFAAVDQTIEAYGTVSGTSGTHYRGPGALVVAGSIAFAGGPTLAVTHRYELLAGRNFLEVTSTIGNSSGSAVENVNMWVGTSDDWIGTTDRPVKVKGQIQGSAATATFNAACSGVTNAIILSTDDEYMMAYSPAAGADTILFDDYNDWHENVLPLAPADSEYDVPASDGSWALYLPFGEIANGAEKSITWYLEGGDLTFPTPQDCSDATSAPASAPAPTLVCTPDPVVPGGRVTCEISGAPADVDILWNAVHGSPFAGAGVRTDAQGLATFSFIAPRGAAGESISVLLVDWTRPLGVQVLGTASPSRVPAGEGGSSLPLALGLMTLAGAGLLGRRLVSAN